MMVNYLTGTKAGGTILEVAGDDGFYRCFNPSESLTANGLPAFPQHVHDAFAALDDAAWHKRTDPPAPTAARIVARIKGEAHSRILALAPEWKQRNMTMRAVELIEKKALGETLTAGELAEETALKAAAALIKTIRAASDAIEADAASFTEADRAAFDVKAAFNDKLA